MPQLLKLVDYHDPILRTPTQRVDFPMSKEDLVIIENMIYSIQPEQLKASKAPWEAAVGMAANQWGINKSIFLYCPSGDTVNELQVIINPSYSACTSILENTPATELAWEGCFSVPLATGNIKREIKIKIKYQDQTGIMCEGELSGWEARVWQHENDHLNGFLYDDPRTNKCTEKLCFATHKELDDFYASKKLEARK